MIKTCPDFSFFCIYIMSFRRSTLSSYIPLGPPVLDPRGCGKLHIMWTLYHRIQFFLRCESRKLIAWSLRYRSIFIPSWYCINHESICTTGKVLKMNEIYTYKEGGYVDIVRLIDVHTDKGFLYCSLYFFSKKKITTVSQIMQKNTYIVWRLMDNREFDEIMDRRLWREIEEQIDLLEFNY